MNMNKLALLYLPVCFVALFSVLASTYVWADGCVFRKAETVEISENIELRPQRINTQEAYDTSSELNGTLFIPLIGHIEFYLAESFVYNEEKKTLTIKIDQNCKWSDGHPIVAEDFVTGARELYSVKGLDLPSLGFIKNGLKVHSGKLPFEALGIKAVDDYSIEYTTDYMPELAKQVLSLPPYAPLPTHKIQGNPDYWLQKKENFSYSGPFAVKTFSGERLQLEKNPYFCKGRRQLVDEVEILYNQSYQENPDVDMLLRDNIDLLGPLTTRLQKSLLSVKEIAQNYELINSNEAAIVYLSFNPKRKAFSDKRVREALRLAYDRNFLNNGTIGAVAGEADSFSYRYPGYNPPMFPWSVKPYAQAVADARKLMEDAGYSKERPLKLAITGWPGMQYNSIGSFIQSAYSQIHVQVKLIVESAEEYIERVESVEKNFDMQIYYWIADFPDPYNFLEAIWQNDFVSPAVKDKFNALLVAATKALNYQDRLAHLAKAEQVLIDDAYLIPAGRPVKTWLKKKSSHYTDAARPTARDLTFHGCS